MKKRLGLALFTIGLTLLASFPSVPSFAKENSLIILDQDNKPITGNVNIGFFDTPEQTWRDEYQHAIIQSGIEGEYALKVTSEEKFHYTFTLSEENEKNIPLAYYITIDGKDVLGTSEAYVILNKQEEPTFSYKSPEKGKNVRSLIQIHWQWAEPQDEEEQAFYQTLGETAEKGVADLIPTITISGEENPDPVPPSLPDTSLPKTSELMNRWQTVGVSMVCMSVILFLKGRKRIKESEKARK